MGIKVGECPHSAAAAFSSLPTKKKWSQWWNDEHEAIALLHLSLCFVSIDEQIIFLFDLIIVLFYIYIFWSYLFMHVISSIVAFCFRYVFMSYIGVCTLVFIWLRVSTIKDGKGIAKDANVSGRSIIYVLK